MTVYCFPWGPLRDTTGMIRQRVLLLWEEEEESLGIYCSLVISRCTSRGMTPKRDPPTHHRVLKPAHTREAIVLLPKQEPFY